MRVSAGASLEAEWIKGATHGYCGLLQQISRRDDVVERVSDPDIPHKNRDGSVRF